MNYKEEIINALANVCKRARKEGYEEADSNQRENAVYEYERGLNEAWECAKKLRHMDYSTLYEVFKGDDVVIHNIQVKGLEAVFEKYSASEVITKIKEHEESKKQADEIKVGDEVDVPQLDCKGIVIAEANKETILVLSEYMDGLLRTEKHNVKKTGRYFSEIGEMKKKMQVDDKDN